MRINLPCRSTRWLRAAREEGETERITIVHRSGGTSQAGYIFVTLQPCQ
jgi:hypothetical protein